MTDSDFKQAGDPTASSDNNIEEEVCDDTVFDAGHKFCVDSSSLTKKNFPLDMLCNNSDRPETSMHEIDNMLHERLSPEHLSSAARLTPDCAVSSLLSTEDVALRNVSLEGVALASVFPEGVALRSLSLEGVALTSISPEGMALTSLSSQGVALMSDCASVFPSQERASDSLQPADLRPVSASLARQVVEHTNDLDNINGNFNTQFHDIRNDSRQSADRHIVSVSGQVSHHNHKDRHGGDVVDLNKICHNSSDYCESDRPESEGEGLVSDADQAQRSVGIQEGLVRIRSGADVRGNIPEFGVVKNIEIDSKKSPSPQPYTASVFRRVSPGIAQRSSAERSVDGAQVGVARSSSQRSSVERSVDGAQVEIAQGASQRSSAERSVDVAMRDISLSDDFLDSSSIQQVKSSAQPSRPTDLNCVELCSADSHEISAACDDRSYDRCGLVTSTNAYTRDLYPDTLGKTSTATKHVATHDSRPVTLARATSAVEDVKLQMTETSSAATDATDTRTISSDVTHMSADATHSDVMTSSDVTSRTRGSGGLLFLTENEDDVVLAPGGVVLDSRQVCEELFSYSDALRHMSIGSVDPNMTFTLSPHSTDCEEEGEGGSRSGSLSTEDDLNMPVVKEGLSGTDDDDDGDEGQESLTPVAQPCLGSLGFTTQSTGATRLPQHALQESADRKMIASSPPMGENNATVLAGSNMTSNVISNVASSSVMAGSGSDSRDARERSITDLDVAEFFSGTSVAEKLERDRRCRAQTEVDLAIRDIRSALRKNRDVIGPTGSGLSLATPTQEESGEPIWVARSRNETTRVAQWQTDMQRIYRDNEVLRETSTTTTTTTTTLGPGTDDGRATNRQGLHTPILDDIVEERTKLLENNVTDKNNVTDRNVSVYPPNVSVNPPNVLVHAPNISLHMPSIPNAMVKPIINTATAVAAVTTDIAIMRAHAILSATYLGRQLLSPYSPLPLDDSPLPLEDHPLPHDITRKGVDNSRNTRHSHVRSTEGVAIECSPVSFDEHQNSTDYCNDDNDDVDRRNGNHIDQSDHSADDSGSRIYQSDRSICRSVVGCRSESFIRERDGRVMSGRTDDDDGGVGGVRALDGRSRWKREGCGGRERNEYTDYNTDEETDELLKSKGYRQAGSIPAIHPDNMISNSDMNSSSTKLSPTKETLVSRPKELLLPDPDNRTVLIEGVLFRTRYLGSTKLISDCNPTKAKRMLQAQECVGRIKTRGKVQYGSRHQSADDESQPSTDVDLFVSAEKIMVLDTDRQEVMMDHALQTISYIADIDDILVVMARQGLVNPSPSSGEGGGGGGCEEGGGRRKRQVNICCHVFQSDEAQLIAQSIGQAFQVAYAEFLKANGIEDPGLLKDVDYQEVLNQQQIFGEELNLFSKKEMQKEVLVTKLKSEALGVVIVESGWGSMLPTVVIANLCPSGAVARNGHINIGDQIISLNGTSLVGLPLSTCQNYIKATRHQTVVKLTLVSCPPVVEVLIKRPDAKYQLGFSVQNGVICSLLRGGIGERGGVRVGHRIIEINGHSMVAVPHERIVHVLATSIGEIHMKTMQTSIFRLLTGQDIPHYI